MQINPSFDTSTLDKPNLTAPKNKTVSAINSTTTDDVITSLSGNPQPSSDTVALSPIAGKLDTIRQALSSAPTPVDSEKVARIKAQIMNGELQIDARKIAGGLLQTAKELLA
jgi:negative regulator of flagellin synthesis FlgM